MPRPRPPRRNGIADDQKLAELAGLDSIGYAVLKADVARVVDEARKAWAPGRGPGRRPEDLRNTLIIALATAFHARSERTHPGDYADCLHDFLVYVLVSNGYNFRHTRLLRLVPSALRIPR